VVFLTRLQPRTSDRFREERQRRRAIDTVWRLKMKGFSKISLYFLFFRCFVVFSVYFNASVLFVKKRIFSDKESRASTLIDACGLLLLYSIQIFVLKKIVFRFTKDYIMVYHASLLDVCFYIFKIYFSAFASLEFRCIISWKLMQAPRPHHQQAKCKKYTINDRTTRKYDKNTND
jgi:hypothetical protein